MAERETNLLGIPIPSDNKVFVAIVVIHIALALACLISGLVAMFSDKTSTRHSNAGGLYFWLMLCVFITIIPLAIMRWPHNNDLLIIGILAFALAYAGRSYARKHRQHWPRLHTICMGASYILLLTGFYIDNGKNLPFWKQFPQYVFWIFPSAIGIPIIIYALKNHPLNKAK